MQLKTRLTAATKYLRADIIAGITIGFLLIPQSMAYSELAGLPAYYGLYSAFLPVIIGALFGHLPQLGQGPTAMTSILTASVLVSAAPPGSAEYIRLAFVLAFCVGIIRLLIGLLRLASITNVVSGSVIAGFTNAGAIIIVLKQVPKFFGISVSTEGGFLGSLLEFRDVVINLDKIAIPVLVMGILSGSAIVLIRKFQPKLPSVLIVLIASIIISSLIGYEKITANAVVGEIPKGFPDFMFLGRPYFSFNEIWHDITLVFPGSIMVALISMMEVLSVSQAACYRTDQKMNMNRELTGQGIAAIIGSFFQAFPTGGSFSRTALNLHTGCKTRMNILVSGLFVMLVLLVLTPLLYHLPLSVLAAIIAISVFSLIRPHQIINSFDISIADGVSAVLTFIATLVFAPSIHKGILAGIAFSLILHISGSMRPRADILGKHEDGSLRESSFYKVEKHKQIIILRFDSSLSFLTAKAFEQAVINVLADHEGYRAFLLIADGINRIDTTGMQSLNQAVNEIRKDKLDFFVCGIKAEPLSIMEKTGTAAVIGKDHMFSKQQSAINHIEALFTPRNKSDN